ncbi:MAG: hypothetical protein WCW27_03560 [Patescibacteria group bacterium]|jgi:Tfp pilus assembly protein PilO
MDISKNKIYQIVDKYFAYSLAIIFGVLILFGGYFIIYPQYVKFQNSGKQTYQQSVTVLEQRQQYLADLKTMEQYYQQLDKRLLVVVNQVLPAATTEQLFAEIEAVFSKTNFTVQSINIANTAPTSPTTSPASGATNNTGVPKGFTRTQVTVNIVGNNTNYEDFKKLLQQLENNARILELSSLSYSPGADSFTLLLQVYQRNLTTP